LDEQTSLPGSISYHPITIRILIGLIRRHGPRTLFLCFTKQGSLLHVTEARWTFDCVAGSRCSAQFGRSEHARLFGFFEEMRSPPLFRQTAESLQRSLHGLFASLYCLSWRLFRGCFGNASSALCGKTNLRYKVFFQSGELPSRPLLRVLVGNILLRHLTCAVLLSDQRCQPAHTCTASASTGTSTSDQLIDVLRTRLLGLGQRAANPHFCPRCAPGCRNTQTICHLHSLGFLLLTALLDFRGGLGQGFSPRGSALHRLGYL